MDYSPAPEKASVQKTLLDEHGSSFEKYKTLIVGKKGIRPFLKYELITGLFSWIPGALGLFLRRIFYPYLFDQVGRGVIFGRNLTLRHPHKIRIGDNVTIDDYAVLDAKGESNEGIMLGDKVIIGRNTTLSCKEGSIRIGEYVNISANCSLLSETLIDIGPYCFLAGHCYLVAGGNHSFDRLDVPIMFQPSIIKSGIVLEEDCWLAASVVVVDGVRLGKGSIAAAGSILAKSFPPYSVALGNPAVRIKTRGPVET
ncbi:MAG: acyltransferase [Candidatus Aminicenantes bacterium]|nr:acyltransferase [Candidatus Aminicenantes bacterium]